MKEKLGFYAPDRRAGPAGRQHKPNLPRLLCKGFALEKLFTRIRNKRCGGPSTHRPRCRVCRQHGLRTPWSDMG